MYETHAFVKDFSMKLETLPLGSSPGLFLVTEVRPILQESVDHFVKVLCVFG